MRYSKYQTSQQTDIIQCQQEDRENKNGFPYYDPTTSVGMFP
jgi:hypothetical protein